MEQLNKKMTELLTLISMKPTTTEIIISLIVSFCMAMIMVFTYRKANTKSTYSPRFAVTIVTLSLLSTILMDLIQSNLALSLGMLGSLSIVRFRSTIKDPRDIGYIFWAMSIGLAAATNSYVIGIVGSLVVCVCMVVTGKHINENNEMLLVVRGSKTNLDRISNVVDDECVRNKVRAKNIMSDSFELVYEVNVPMKNSNNLIEKLFKLNGIDTVNLLAEAKNA